MIEPIKILAKQFWFVFKMFAVVYLIWVIIFYIFFFGSAFLLGVFFPQQSEEWVEYILIPIYFLTVVIFFIFILISVGVITDKEPSKTIKFTPNWVNVIVFRVGAFFYGLVTFSFFFSLLCSFMNAFPGFFIGTDSVENYLLFGAEKTIEALFFFSIELPRFSDLNPTSFLSKNFVNLYKFVVDVALVKVVYKLIKRELAKKHINVTT